MSEDRFHTLNDKIEALIAHCSDMKKENQLLRASEHHWQEERLQLLEKNKLAKSRLQSILARLKSMEQV